MWRALDNVVGLVREGGRLFIALYRDQSWRSTAWRWVKRKYNSGRIARALVVGVFFSFFFLRGLVADVVHLKNPLRRYAEYKKSRGMSRTHDWADWLGGFPYEVASAEATFDFLRARGFHLETMRLSSGHGCNQFVFSRTRSAPGADR
jgi:2-polyprenyl-6-hydroxyphenyl methylase/3-demethylubiquinone-9 3-methyltransferase